MGVRLDGKRNPLLGTAVAPRLSQRSVTQQAHGATGTEETLLAGTGSSPIPAFSLGERGPERASGRHLHSPDGRGRGGKQAAGKRHRRHRTK